MILLIIGFATAAKLDIIADITNAIKTGNAHEIAKYFSTNVDLTILNQEEVYSKVQAEVVLQDFLSKNQPKSFVILHQGNKDDAEYVIGTYTNTQGDSYRVYFFVKQTGVNKAIQDLRFEKE